MGSWGGIPWTVQGRPTAATAAAAAAAAIFLSYKAFSCNAGQCAGSLSATLTGECVIKAGPPFFGTTEPGRGMHGEGGLALRSEPVTVNVTAIQVSM